MAHARSGKFWHNYDIHHCWRTLFLASLLGAFSVTLFGDSTVATYAVLQTEIDGGVIDDHVLAVISTILAFMTIVGLFSFIRGFFILREVAEGHSQASIMAAITHNGVLSL